MFKRWRLFGLFICIIFFLQACGSGGGSGSTTNSSVPPTEAEDINNISLSVVSPWISEIGPDYVKLSWDPVDGATSYNIYYAWGRSTDPISIGRKITGITNTSYTVTGLGSGDTNNVFAVTATNGTVVSDRSITLIARAHPSTTYPYLLTKTERVDDSALPNAGPTRLALDSNGFAHVLYQDGVTGDIRYATNASGYWIISTPRSIQTNAYAFDIAVDNNDIVHICWGKGSLLCISNTTSDWPAEQIDGGGSLQITYVSVSTDFYNNLFIKYTDGYYGTKYATNSGNAWSITYTEPVVPSLHFQHSGKVNSHTTTIVDQQSQTHRVYGAYNTTTGGIEHSYSTTGDYFALPNEVGGWYWNDMALDSNGKAHIVYTSKFTQYLFYSTNASSTWKTYVVDSDAYQYFPSIYIDNNDKPHISYYSSYYSVNPNYRDVKYVYVP